MSETAYPVIAGRAALSAVGDRADECFDRLVAGESGIGPLVAYPVERFGVRHAYQVSEPARREREHLLATQLLVKAIRDAADDAGLGSLRDVPVIVGTGLGESRTVESAWLDGKPLDEAEASLVEGVRLGTDAEDVQVFSNACSASLYALAAACDLIVAGTADTVVVAGVDVLSQSMFGLLDRVHLESPQSVRPFDAARLGVIMGDGAAAVVLRRQEAGDGTPLPAGSIAVRGVTLGCDAFHATAPDDTGIEHTIRAAHAAAGIEPGDLDAVYAHGTGTVLNDQAEAAALARVIPGTVPVTSVKGATGHTSGGSGLFSLCMAIQTLRGGRLPGTHGLEEVDAAAAGLSLSAAARELADPRLVQVDAFGFGGLNAVAILERDPRPEVLAEAWGRTDRSAATAEVTPEVTSAPADAAPGSAEARVPLLTGPYGSVEILAQGLCFPDDGVHDLAGLSAPSQPGGEPFDLRGAVGRKGFRTMTPATRVAMVAAANAVGGRWAPGSRDAGGAFFDGGLRRGIVAASAHGNTATVCEVASLIDTEGVPAASALELPNASRNVLAATAAIRLGVTGPCLTMDTGMSGGWDALRWAVHLITSGRCDEVLYLVAEAPSVQVAALTGNELAHGSVALLLGRPGAARGPVTGGRPAQVPAGPAHAQPAHQNTGIFGVTATLGAALAVVGALVGDQDGATIEGPAGTWQVATR
ncbi:beta-ketoacyl synthase N-terminal-like domain-containing protein [Myceligenerans crystallogenes]|uniref:Ketosynthase family 3 (KS3) domain-containing protein n=1 Tax=Myceligenerans crystallogenes TaxID=316335 RepID=A0ABP4ZSV7_9MICO